MTEATHGSSAKVSAETTNESSPAERERPTTTDDGPTPDVTFPGTDRRGRESAERALGDFTTTPVILRLVPLAVVVGALGAGISLALLDMIGFFTNLFYYQRVSVHLVSPNANTLGVIAVVIPV